MESRSKVSSEGVTIADTVNSSGWVYMYLKCGSVVHTIITSLIIVMHIILNVYTSIGRSKVDKNIMSIVKIITSLRKVSFKP